MENDEYLKISKHGFEIIMIIFVITIYFFLSLFIYCKIKIQDYMNIKNVTWNSRKNDNEILQYTCTY